MTAKEFSDLFSVLYNNITSNQALGLDEYEKSVFLTKAQDEIVKNYFLPEGNPKLKGFDDTQKRQMDFSMLMTVALPDNASSVSTIDPRSKVFLWPSNILYVVNEFYNVGTEVSVKPRLILALSYTEYTRLMSKPYKSPLKYQAWRLITGQQGNRPIVEIILTAPDLKLLGNENGTYEIRYIRKPKPIVLADFSNAYGEELSIDGVNGSIGTNTVVIPGKKIVETPNGTGNAPTYQIENDQYGSIQYIEPTTYDPINPCELHESIHWEILQRAVELAKIAWANDLELIAAVNMITTAGLRSE